MGEGLSRMGIKKLSDLTTGLRYKEARFPGAQ